jgi:hypothetical protein
MLSSHTKELLLSVSRRTMKIMAWTLRESKLWVSFFLKNIASLAPFTVDSAAIVAVIKSFESPTASQFKGLACFSSYASQGNRFRSGKHNWLAKIAGLRIANFWNRIDLNSVPSPLPFAIAFKQAQYLQPAFSLCIVPAQYERGDEYEPEDKEIDPEEDFPINGED